jgi:hypothetical protein
MPTDVRVLASTALAQEQHLHMSSTSRKRMTGADRKVLWKSYAGCPKENAGSHPAPRRFSQCENRRTESDRFASDWASSRASAIAALLFNIYMGAI